MAVCQYHRDRPGIGVCMRCRAVICQECSTRLDGVNHCHRCLEELGRHPERRERGRFLSLLAAVAVLGLGWLLLVAFCWNLQGSLAP